MTRLRESARAAGSVRTAAEPMAFTNGEFLRGAVTAWLLFVAFDAVAFGTLFFPSGLMLVAVVAAPVSFLALLVFAMPAWWLGRSLRRQRRVAVHLTVFAGFGLVVALLSTAAYFLMATGTVSVESASLLLWLPNVVAGVSATLLGWRRGARAVLAVTPRASDPDGIAEDALAEAERSGRPAGA